MATRASHSAARTAAEACASAKRSSTAPGSASRSTPARRRDRRRVAGDADAALPTRRLGRRTVDTTHFSDGPHTPRAIAPPTSPATSAASRRADGADRQQPAGPPAQPRPRGGRSWRRVDDFDLSWANPDQGRGQPDLGRLLAGHRARRLRHRRPVRAGPRHRRRCPTAPSRPRRLLLHLWLRDEAGNDEPGLGDRRRRCASTTCRRASPSPVPTPARSCRTRCAPTLGDEHSGPAKGDRVPAAGGESWLELPTKLDAGEAPGRRACRRRAREPRARHLRLPGRRRSTGRATRPRPRAAPTAPRWRCARRRRRSAEPPGCRGERSRPRRRRRGSSPTALAQARRHRR